MIRVEYHVYVFVSREAERAKNKNRSLRRLLNTKFGQKG